MTAGNITALVETLVSVGATPEQILAAVRIAEAQKDAALEASREKARTRVQNWRDRNKAETVRNVTGRSVADTSRLTRGDARGLDNLPKEVISRQEVRKKEEEPAAPSVREFSEFWTLFPNKVGKRDAEKAFASARLRADLPAILAGVSRYAAKTDDRPWCNPATFLNQDRWADQPAEPPLQRATAPPGRKPNHFDAYETIARERGWTNEPEILPSHHDNVEFLPPEPSRSSGAVVDLRSGVGRRFRQGD